MHTYFLAISLARIKEIMPVQRGVRTMGIGASDRYEKVPRSPAAGAVARETAVDAGLLTGT